MSKEVKFFVCEHCGNMIEMIKNSGVPIKCCGEDMKELIPNSTDASAEKHVPIVTVTGKTVTVDVGAVFHPMSDAHYIEWIYLSTEKGGFKRALSPSDAPQAVFELQKGDKALAAYAYCNLHGLWKKDI